MFPLMRRISFSQKYIHTCKWYAKEDAFCSSEPKTHKVITGSPLRWADLEKKSLGMKDNVYLLKTSQCSK